MHHRGGNNTTPSGYGNSARAASDLQSLNWPFRCWWWLPLLLLLLRRSRRERGRVLTLFYLRGRQPGRITLPTYPRAPGCSCYRWLNCRFESCRSMCAALLLQPDALLFLTGELCSRAAGEVSLFWWFLVFYGDERRKIFGALSLSSGPWCILYFVTSWNAFGKM